MYNLTNTDYKKILTHYGKLIPSNKSKTKRAAEDLITLKLCNCIKKINVPMEEKSIKVCSNSIFKKRGLIRGKFKCKNGRSIRLKKIRNKTLKMG